MNSPDNLLYEYAVVRYVPRVDREEFINIGLLMLCKRQKWMKGEINLDFKRLEAFDSRVDMERLIIQASLFERRDVPESDLPIEEKYRWLTAVKSAVLQVSSSHPGFINKEINDKKEAVEILEKEFNRLYRELVLVD